MPVFLSFLDVLRSSETSDSTMSIYIDIKYIPCYAWVSTDSPKKPRTTPIQTTFGWKNKKRSIKIPCERDRFPYLNNQPGECNVHSEKKEYSGHTRRRSRVPVARPDRSTGKTGGSIRWEVQNHRLSVFQLCKLRIKLSRCLCADTVQIPHLEPPHRKALEQAFDRYRPFPRNDRRK